MSIDNDKAMAVLLSSKSLESAKFDRKQLKALIDQAEERGAVGERERQAAEKAGALSELWMHEDMARDETAAVLTLPLSALKAYYVQARHDLASWKRRALEAEAQPRPTAADAAALSASEGKVVPKEVWQLIVDAKYQLEKGRIWNGQSWHYNPLHGRFYTPLLDRLNGVIQRYESDEFAPRAAAVMAGGLVPDAACKQGKCACTTTGCWGQCSLARNPVIISNGGAA